VWFTEIEAHRGESDRMPIAIGVRTVQFEIIGPPVEAVFDLEV